MSIRALYSGVSGLKNFQTQLDVVGNNIANSQTSGFKSSRVTFMSMLSQEISGAAAPTATRGGVNPQQIGLGAVIGSIDKDFEQGNLLSTGRSYDIAIQGDGFFVVTDGTNQSYTRSGAFNFDAQGNLVYGSGFKVMGLNANAGILGAQTEAIQIPLGITLPAAATTTVNLVGNLDSSATQVGSTWQTDRLYAAEQTGQDTNIEGLLAVGSANGLVAGLVDGSTTVTITTGADAGTYTYSSAQVTNPAVSLTFNSLDDLAIAVASDISDISAVTVNGDGALQMTSGAAGNSLTVTSNLTVLQTAMSTADRAVGAFNAGVNSVSDEFSHVSSSTDAMVNLRNASGTDLGLVNGDSVTLDGDVGGTAVTQGTFAVTGVNTLADFANEIQSILGVTTNGNVSITGGRLVIDGDGGSPYELSDLNFTTSGTRANFDAMVDNSSGNYTRTQAAADNHVRSFTAYDSDGTAHTVTMKYNIRDSSGNQNRYVIDISSVITATGVADTAINPASGTIVADPNGSLASFDPASITITPTGVGDPMVINLNAGSTGGYLGIVMFEGDSTVGFRNSDGYASGDLQNVSITANGTVQGNFTNGQIQTLAQLQLAAFDNPQGLKSSGNGVYSQTDNSGTPLVDAPNVGQIGSLVVGSLESSNVDLAREFVTLITAQRGFQTNARVIRTADEVLQELVNIV